MSEPFFAKYMKAEGNPSMAPSEPVREPVGTTETPHRVDFKYLKGKSKLEVDGEWKRNLLAWFAHLRIDVVNHCSCEKEISCKYVIRSIQSGELPKLTDFGVFESISTVLEYFAGDKTTRFNKCELSWLFASLIFVDRLVVDSIANLLENIEERIGNQISATGRTDELYPFLATCSVILTGFFHRQ